MSANVGLMEAGIAVIVLVVCAFVIRHMLRKYGKDAAGGGRQIGPFF